MVDYLIPRTLQELLEFINENDAKIISGGTDLMVQRRNWKELPAIFNKIPVFTFNIPELKYIKTIKNEVHIGANLPISEILNYKDTPKLLKDSINIIASPALRNLATIPGNIVNASPAGDTLPILYLLDALVVVESVSNKSIKPIKEIITGPRKITLRSNEFISEIVIPIPKFTNEKFVKVGGRKADAISKVSFTGAVEIKDNYVVDFRVAFGAVAPTIIRNKDIETQFCNIKVSTLKSNKADVVESYSNLIKPIDDQRSNKEYRKHVALNLLNDFIENI